MEAARKKYNYIKGEACATYYQFGSDDAHEHYQALMISMFGCNRSEIDELEDLIEQGE